MNPAMKSLDSKLIHAGEPRPRVAGAVSLPVFQSSTFEYGGESSYHDVRYIRLNNTPNHKALNDKLRQLENADAAMVTASGMAAISTALLTVLESGGHLLVQECLYGGTHSFVTEDLGRYGLSYDFIDGGRPDTWAAKLKPETRAIYVETMTNPLMQVADLDAAVRFAREHNLISMVDNTFASPVNFRPAERGFDLSLHSASKYLNGHSDIVAGVAIGRGDLIERFTHRLNHLGGTLDPHACFLLHRGLKTLALRVRQQNRSAQALAAALAEHPRVRQVNHPGLKTHPDHDRATELLDGFGGMLSFELDGGVDLAERFLQSVTIPLVAPSLGGIETLVTRPATTSHAGVKPEDRAELGISDALVRVSVGIEDSDELVADFTVSLDQLGPLHPAA